MDSDNDIPLPPDHLNPIAVERWNKFWRNVDHETIKPSVHGDIVAAYCTEYAIWRQANENLNKVGLIVRTGDKIKINPLLGVRDRAAHNMHKLGRKIGLKPGSAVKAIKDWTVSRDAVLAAIDDLLNGVEDVIVDDDSGEENGNAGTPG